MSSVENQSYSDSEVYSPTQTTSSSDTSFSDGTDLLMNRRTSSSELIETDSISLSSRESSFLDEDNPKADLQELISLL